MSTLWPLVTTDIADDEECRVTNFRLDILGLLLLISDSYFDLSWVMTPSRETATALRNYYTTLLTPTVRCYIFPYPGYLFPLFVIYKLCIQCPTHFNFMLLALFIPVSSRYVGILTCDPTEKLQHWWTIVALRMLLAIVTILSLFHWNRL